MLSSLNFERYIYRCFSCLSGSYLIHLTSTIFTVRSTWAKCSFDKFSNTLKFLAQDFNKAYGTFYLISLFVNLHVSLGKKILLRLLSHSTSEISVYISCLMKVASSMNLTRGVLLGFSNFCKYIWIEVTTLLILVSEHNLNKLTTLSTNSLHFLSFLYFQFFFS